MLYEKVDGVPRMSVVRIDADGKTGVGVAAVNVDLPSDACELIPGANQASQTVLMLVPPVCSQRFIVSAGRRQHSIAVFCGFLHRTGGRMRRGPPYHGCVYAGTPHRERGTRLHAK